MTAGIFVCIQSNAIFSKCQHQNNKESIFGLIWNSNSFLLSLSLSCLYLLARYMKVRYLYFRFKTLMCCLCPKIIHNIFIFLNNLDFIFNLLTITYLIFFSHPTQDKYRTSPTSHKSQFPQSFFHYNPQTLFPPT